MQLLPRCRAICGFRQGSDLLRGEILEVLDDGALLLISRRVLCREADHAGFVAQLMRHCVDERLHPRGVPLDHLGRYGATLLRLPPSRIADGVPVLVVALHRLSDQAIDRGSGGAPAMVEELHHHRRPFSRRASSCRSMATREAEMASTSSWS